MSVHELSRRAVTDREFAAAVRNDPASALAEYDVSDDAIEAIESGDEERIRAVLGIEYGAGVPNQGPPRRD